MNLMRGELELSNTDIVIKAYRNLCKQAGKKVPTYKELRATPKAKIIDKYVILRNKMVLFG